MSSSDRQHQNIEGKGGIIRLLREYGGGLSCYAWGGALGSAINGGINVFFFYLFGELINVGSVTPTAEVALELMVKFLLLGLGFLVFNMMQFGPFGMYASGISVKVRESYFGLLLEQDIG